MIKRIRKRVMTFLEILIIVSVILVSFSYIYFRYYKETTFRYNKPLPEEVVTMVNSAIDEIKIANGIQIVKVDLNRNVRYVRHSYFNDPNLNKLYSIYTNSRITTEITVFSGDDQENTRIIRMMNHEVDCIPYKNTLSYKLLPESSKFIEAVCTISIPPAFSEFKGIIAMSLTKIPTEEEKSSIEKILIHLSEQLYKEVK